MRVRKLQTVVQGPAKVAGRYVQHRSAALASASSAPCSTASRRSDARTPSRITPCCAEPPTQIDLGGNTPPPPIDGRSTGGDSGGKDRFSSLATCFCAILAACLAAVARAWADATAFAAWQSRSGEVQAAGREQQVSIVVPVLNEEGALPELLARLRELRPAPAEIIFVDGGSSDRTIGVLEEAGCQVERSPRGRARQMNAGAAAATGDCLCFLHADSKCCRDVVDVIRFELANQRCAAGGFATRVAYKGRTMPWMTAHLFAKTYYAPLLARPLDFVRGLRAVFGDQTIFTRARDFRDAGGFDERLAIMEDADLVMRLHRRGTCERPARRAAIRQVLYRANETCGRRFAFWGPWRATYIHVRISLMWLFGCSPEALRKVYDKLYTDSIRS